MTGFNVEDLVIDLYYWFEKSTKRKASLAEYCTFCDTSYRDIVKHSSTRWLSLKEQLVVFSSSSFHLKVTVFLKVHECTILVYSMH